MKRWGAVHSAACIGEFDWLSNNIATRNIIIYEKAPETTSADDDDVDDYAQSDYEQTFQAVIETEPKLKALIDEIRNTKPPQWGEVNRLKHQVKEGNQHARQRMIEITDLRAGFLIHKNGNK